MQIKSALAHATLILKHAEAALEARILLQHVLTVNHAWLIAHADDQLNSEDETKFNALVARRMAGEPMAYILGYREFYGLKLKVTPDTLIPRPDTETLVEAALDKMALNSTLNICDLGTGTGAIALAIAKQRPQSQVTAVDFSKQALLVAQQNAQQLHISNIRFLHSDWFSALTHQRFDIIVSNPPYIEASDHHLSQGDLRFEPINALVSGADGFDDIRNIIALAPNHLAQRGWLMLEHGYNQAAQVARCLHQAGFKDVAHVQDLAGIQRVTLGCLK